MKSIAIALAAILVITAASWAATTPAPIALTHSQLIAIVQHATDDPGTLKDLAGAHVALDLRPGTTYPYFVAAEDRRGIAFICQVGFEDFAGGPIAATVIRCERGEDARDYVKLDACTALER